VIARSIMAFENCSLIDEIIIVAKKEEYPLYKEMLSKYRFKKIKHITPGGDSRGESALKGFVRIDDRSEYVAIHDAARCLITPELISATVREAYSVGAAAPCHKISDTVKMINGKGFVESTPDRELLRAVETPQVFKTELYRAAAYTAKQKSLSFTDDCALAESIGYAVKLVESDGSNIKITEKRDILLAELLLKERDENS